MMVFCRSACLLDFDVCGMISLGVLVARNLGKSSVLVICFYVYHIMTIGLVIVTGVSMEGALICVIAYC